MLLIIVGVVIFVGGIFHYDNRRRAGVSNTGCQGSLAECFQKREVMDFSDHEQIDQKEFEDLLIVVSDDIDSKIRTQLDPARADYDTPFFTGNSTSGDGEVRPDQMVCFGDQCYQQSGVNYVAQGMYAAASGQDLDDAQSQANTWNQFWYHHEASKDELFWLEYGYKYYKNKKINQPK